MNDDIPLQDNELKAQRDKANTDQVNAAGTFASDLRWLMSSPRGRRFMWWLLALTGMRRLSFNNSGSITAFNEGQRNVGLAVQAALDEHCHASYLTMLEEQQQKAK